MLKSVQDHRYRLNRIFTSFEENSERIAAKYSVKIEYSGWKYKGKKQIKDKISGNRAFLDFGSYSVVFSYHRYNMINQQSSLLKLDLALKPDQARMIIPFDLVMDKLNPSDFTPFLYQNLYDDTLMTLAFDELDGLLSRYQKDIERLVDVQNELDGLMESVKVDMKAYYIKPERYDYYLDYKAFRFSISAYQNFLLGNYQKSIPTFRKTNKFGNISAYEKRILDLMEVRNSIEGYRPKELVLSQFVENYRYFKPNGISIYHKQSALSIFVSWLVMFVMSSLFAYVMLSIFDYWVSSGTLFASSQSWTYGLLVGVNLAYPLSFSLWAWTHARLYRKDHERYLDLKALSFTENDNKLIRVILSLWALVFLIFLVLGGLDQVTLREKTFTVDNFLYDFTLLKPYEYDQIDYVEYRTRLMVDGKEKEDENYTIVMKDGKEFYLYGTVSIKTVETKILPILVEKNVTVKKRKP